VEGVGAESIGGGVERLIPVLLGTGD